jgi:hypothetical protein
MNQYVSASDSWGNYTPQFQAQNGQLFHVTKTLSGDALSSWGSATSVKEIQVVNNLQKGSINVQIYKDGKLLATKTGLAPAQKAAFGFKPTLWIGVTSQVVEGQVMNSAIISQVNTELSLLGIASADIVMTGSGAGVTSQPLSFSLQNIVMA